MLTALLLIQALAFQPTTTETGVERSWEEMPVHWRYDDSERPEYLSEDAVLEAVRASFESWNAVPNARVRFIEDDGGVPESEVNVVYWQPEWSWDEDVLAITSTWAAESGEILKFRIAINAKDPDWGTDGHRQSMDVQNALTHEVGHSLGLAHDPRHGEATMAATAKRGEVRKRDLHSSDQEGARYLYPGPNAGTSSCSSAPEPAFLALFAPLILAVRRRRT
ncbi:MAG: matrixin family metalloprotease [Myxococcota bacterium]